MNQWFPWDPPAPWGAPRNLGGGVRLRGKRFEQNEQHVGRSWGSHFIPHFIIALYSDFLFSPPVC